MRLCGSLYGASPWPHGCPCAGEEDHRFLGFEVIGHTGLLPCRAPQWPYCIDPLGSSSGPSSLVIQCETRKAGARSGFVPIMCLRLPPVRWQQLPGMSVHERGQWPVFPPQIVLIWHRDGEGGRGEPCRFRPAGGPELLPWLMQVSFSPHNWNPPCHPIVCRWEPALPSGRTQGIIH